MARALLAAALAAGAAGLRAQVPQAQNFVLDTFELDDPCWLLLMGSPQRKDVPNGRVPCSVSNVGKGGHYDVLLVPRPRVGGELKDVPANYLKRVNNDEYVAAVKNFSSNQEAAFLGAQLAVADETKRSWLANFTMTNDTSLDERRENMRKAASAAILARRTFADEVTSLSFEDVHKGEDLLDASDRQREKRRLSRQEQVKGIEAQLKGKKPKKTQAAVLQSLKVAQQMDDEEAEEERLKVESEMNLTKSFSSGLYRVHIPGTRVMKSPRLGAPTIQSLPVGTMVNVIYISNREEDPNVRAFIEKPMGFMPIYQKSNKLYFAEHQG